MKYNLVIFDLDNTLLDFDKMELGSLRECFEKHNIKISKELIASYMTINKKLWDELEDGMYTKAEILVLRFKKLFEKFNIDKDPVQVNLDYLNGMSNHIHLMDFALEVLDYLKDKVKLVIMTNGVKLAQDAKMEKSGLNKYFSEVIISDVVGYHKPNTKIFEYLEEKIGFIDKEKTIIIGDSLTSDIQGGINYGIKTCWYNPKSLINKNKLQIDYEIDALSGLFKVLE